MRRPGRRRKSGATKRPKLKRREAYRRVAERFDGELLEGKRDSMDRVVIPRGPWRIWLDTYTVSTGQVTVTYTRARAYFLGRRELRIKLRRRNWFDRLLGGLGFGRLPPVDPRLNEAYVIKGSPEGRVPSLFSAPGLTDAVLAVPSLNLEVKKAPRKIRKRSGEDVGEVVSQAAGVITDVERLAGMLRAVGETLEALERIAEAKREPVPES